MGGQDITEEITDLKPGSHICCFYHDEKEHEELVTSYILRGLENGEKVVYILDKHDQRIVQGYLEKAYVDVKHFTQKGQLVFYHSQDTYTRKGYFDPHLFFKDLEDIYNEALEQGYPAVRGSGEMSWILKYPENIEKLLEYENGLNHFLRDKNFYALCQYDVADFDNNFLLDILFLHPKIALGTRILNNFYYIPTNEYHGNNLPDSAFKTYMKNLIERGSYEEHIQLSRRRYKNLFENSPISLWEEDFSRVKHYIEKLKQDGVEDLKKYLDQHPETVKKLEEMIEIIDVNQRTLELYAAKDLEELKKYQNEIFTSDSIETLKKGFVAIFEEKNSFSGEAVALTLNGEKRYVLVKTFTAPGHEKDYSRVIIAIIDLTKRRIIEEQLKKSNKKNEMLLNEIHHRVKNNMQIISSILNLQTFFIEDKDSKQALNDCRNRVRSMGFIHEKLYQSGDFSQIKMEDYVKTLSREIFKTYSVSSERVKLEINISDIKLDINQAIPTGLIINELLTNSIKYAFPNRKGMVEIVMKEMDGLIHLEVKDNGIGFPPDFDIIKSETLGLQLVSNLVKQLGGTITLERSRGTHFLIEFPRAE